MFPMIVLRSWFALIVFCSVHVLGVGSVSLSISPKHVRINTDLNTVTISCTADVALTGCQVMWWDNKGKTGPLLDLSRGLQAQTNPTYLGPELSDYSYSGRGLRAGDCGVTLQVNATIKKWMVGCRVRVAQGAWKYTWTDIFASGYSNLPHTVTPREVIVLPGGNATLMCKVQEPLGRCYFSVPNVGGLNFDKGSQSLNSTGRHLYHKKGLPSGECGLTVMDADEADNGAARCYVYKSGAAESSFIPIIVARPPSTPDIVVSYTRANLTAFCTVDASRPVANITWLLDEETLRQDEEDDAVVGLDAPWRWPWDIISITQRVERRLTPGDHGKLLKCVVTHVTLTQPLEATHEVIFPGGEVAVEVDVSLGSDYV